MLYHDIFGVPGRGRRLRNPEVVSSASIFIIVFFINGFITHGAQEKVRRNGSRRKRHRSSTRFARFPSPTSAVAAAAVEVADDDGTATLNGSIAWPPCDPRSGKRAR